MAFSMIGNYPVIPALLSFSRLPIVSRVLLAAKMLQEFYAFDGKMIHEKYVRVVEKFLGQQVAKPPADRRCNVTRNCRQSPECTD